MTEQEIKDKIKSFLTGNSSVDRLINYFDRKRDIFFLENEIFTCYCAKYQFPHNPILDSYVDGEVAIDFDGEPIVEIDLEYVFNLDTHLPLDTYIEILECIREFIDSQYQINNSTPNEIAYLDGKRHGECKFYNPGNKMICVGAYEFGKQVGIWRTYYSTGQLFKENNFDRIGVKKYIETKWFADGKKEQDFTIQKDSEEFRIEGFDMKGQKKYDFFYFENGMRKKDFYYYTENIETFGDFKIREYKGGNGYIERTFKGDKLFKFFEIDSKAKSCKYIEYDEKGLVKIEKEVIDGKEVLN